MGYRVTVPERRDVGDPIQHLPAPISREQRDEALWWPIRCGDGIAFPYSDRAKPSDVCPDCRAAEKKEKTDAVAS